MGKAKKTAFDMFNVDMGAFGQDGMGAFTKSMEVMTNGMQDIMKTSMEMAQESAQKQTKLYKDAMTCKTLSEWANMHNKMTQSSYDDFMSGTTKITEMSVKVMTEVTAPVNEQLSKAVQQVSSAMAA